MNIFKVARLKEKKHRKETGLFIVEGEKAVLETIAVHPTWHIEHVHATADFCSKFGDKMKSKRIDFSLADSGELAKAGSMEVQAAAIAVVRMPGVVGYAEKGFEKFAEEKKVRHVDIDFEKERVVVALDGIKDPGNLGTIMRTADWFGVSNIMCGTDTVDTFNPKTIAASMGSFLRVKTVQLELEDILASAHSNGIAIYTTAMKGTMLSEVTFKKPCIIVMGSESHGVKPNLLSLATETVTIPRIGKAESLNVGVAAGIILQSVCK